MTRQTLITPDQARAISKEAHIYGFPLVDSYRIQYSYFVDRAGPEYKAPWNTLFNNGGSTHRKIKRSRPIAGGPPVRITNSGHAFLKWSSDATFLLITPGLFASATKSYLIALSPGQLLPQFPAADLSQTEFSNLSGARVMDYGDVALGATPDVYAFSRETVQGSDFAWETKSERCFIVRLSL